MDSLPVIALQKILDYSDNYTIYFVIPYVCKQWQEKCKNYLKMRVINTDTFNRHFKHNDSIVSSIVKNYTLMELETSYLTKSGTSCIEKHCKYLEKIKLMSSHILPNIFSNNTNLRKIDLSQCYNVSDQKIMTINMCTKLIDLDLYCCYDLSDESVISIAKCCSKLERIRLWKTKISDESLCAIAENCKGIKKLDILGCKIGDIGIQKLAEECKFVTSLNLYDTYITDKSMSYIGNNFPILRELSVGGTKITDNGVLCIRNVKLQSLSLTHCEGVSYTGISNALENCPKLGYISVGGCYISEHDIIDITKNYPTITILCRVAPFNPIYITDE